MKLAVAAVAAGLGLFILPAAAQDAPASPLQPASPITEASLNRDVHCYIVFMGLSAAPDMGGPAMQAGARMMAFYWFGKLSGQISDADLEHRLIVEGPNLKGDVIKDDVVRCTGEVSERTEAMDTILKHVGAAGTPSSEAPAPEGQAPQNPAPGTQTPGKPDAPAEKAPPEKTP